MNTFHTIISGALGGLSFGIFHGYITHKMITKQNTELFDYRMKLMETQMIQMKYQVAILRVIVGYSKRNQFRKNV